jgi:hypothetical protein
LNNTNVVDKALFSVGLLFFAVSVLFACLLAPLYAAFFAYNSVFPLIQLVKYAVNNVGDGGGDGGGGGESGAGLAVMLTLAHIVTLCTLLLFTRSVMRFQRARGELVDMSGLPDRFYCADVVKEIEFRHFCLQRR